MFLHKFKIDTKEKSNLKILALSDIHKYKIKPNSIIYKYIVGTRPNIILFLGDMVSRTSKDFSSIEDLAEFCSFRAKTFAILGNHEQDLPEKNLQKLMGIYKKAGVIVLDNKTVKIGKNVTLSGFTSPRETYFHKGEKFEKVKSIDIAGFLKKPNSNFYNILLSHNPKYFHDFVKWGADLTLSGHVHGGIVRIKNVGILSPERVFFPKYSKGGYIYKNKKMIVSAGIGKFRLNNPPELLYVKLY